MPTITVQIGPNGQPIDLTNLNPKDLFTGLTTNLPFTIGGAIAAVANLNQPISTLADGTSGTLSYAANPSFTPGGGPVTFSLQANAAASITVRSKGHLLSYQNSFDSTQPKTNFDGKPGAVYVITELTFGISGNLKATAPLGATGVTVSTNDSASASFTIRNYKAFSPNETIENALVEAIAGFTLPLHAATATNLNDGDALYYEFDGAVNVGFGLNYGISGSVGGYSLGDISPTLQTISQFANISAKQGLTAGANLGVSLAFNWSRTFTCFLTRSKPDQGAGSATLHLMIGTDTMRSLELKANGGITSITAPQVTVNTDTLTQFVLQKSTGQAAPVVPQQVKDAVNGEVQKYVKDANQWLSSLTKKVQSNGQISLSLLFQNSTADTSAFTWDFDVANNAFNNAWNAAVQGDFLGALKTGAATLEAGSGFESEHTRNTKLTLTFFGLMSETLDSYFSRSTLRYGQDGVFYLENQSGNLVSTTNKNKSSSTSIYLDATAQLASGGNGIANLQIQLHGVVSAAGDSDQLSRLGLVLQSMGTWLGGAAGQQGVDLGTTFKTFARQSQSPGSSNVHVIYDLTALARLRSDAYVNGNQPKPPHLLDAANWNAYVAACDTVPTDPSTYLTTRIDGNFYEAYSSWEAFNRITNGFTDGSGATGPQFKTDRHATIGLVTSSVAGSLRSQPPFSDALSDIDMSELSFYFYAGQQYMNLCDDVHQVVAKTANASLNWSRIVNALTRIIDADVDAWYGSTVLLALLKSTSSSSLSIDQSKLDPSTASGSVVLHIA